jgi:hypothetical protein
VHAKSAIMLGRAQTSRHRQRINIRGQRCDQRTPHASALPTNVTFSSSYAQIKRSRHCCHSRPRQPRKTCLLVAKCGRGSHTREYRRRSSSSSRPGGSAFTPFGTSLHAQRPRCCQHFADGRWMVWRTSEDSFEDPGVTFLRAANETPAYTLDVDAPGRITQRRAVDHYERQVPPTPCPTAPSRSFGIRHLRAPYLAILVSRAAWAANCPSTRSTPSICSGADRTVRYRG